MGSERNKTWVGNGGWLCLYGGLLAVVLGIVFQRQGAVLEDLVGVFQAGGALLAAVGVFLIWLRSVMK